MATERRLPPGATTNPKSALETVEDAAKLSAAFAYWRDRIKAEGEDILETGSPSSDAWKFAVKLPDEQIDDLDQESKELFSGMPRAVLDDFLIKTSGCLLSAQEIARTASEANIPAGPDPVAAVVEAVGSVVSPPSLAQHLESLRTAAASAPAKDSPEARKAAHGLIATRETFDALRRFRIVTTLSSALGVPRSVLLALWRQESALVVSPPVSSYAHAPLVLTPSPCRPEKVTLGILGGLRPGFNLVFQRNTSAPLATTTHDISRRMGLLFRNLLVLGGLDSVAIPRLSGSSAGATSHPNDELVQFLSRAKAAGTPQTVALNSAYRSHLSGGANNQQRLFDETSLGLLMVGMEAHGSPGAAPLPGAETLLDMLKATWDGLFSSHTSASASNNHITLSADELGSETKQIVLLQASWFASRSHLDTLLAWRDRGGAVARLSKCSPLLTYLRFHLGDAPFAGILLRTVIGLEDIYRKALRDPWPGSEAFENAFNPHRFSRSEANSLKHDLVTHFATSAVSTQTAWRHIGLIDKILTAGMPPAWLSAAAAPNHRLSKTADIVRKLLEVVEARDFLPAIEALFAVSPIRSLRSLNLVSAATDAEFVTRLGMPLVKAHSFDRLRQIYAKTHADAGLPDS